MTTPLTIFAPLSKAFALQSFREAGIEFVHIDDTVAVKLKPEELDADSIQVVIPLCVNPQCGCVAGIPWC